MYMTCDTFEPIMSQLKINIASDVFRIKILFMFVIDCLFN
jgi:hypothetical protein